MQNKVANCLEYRCGKVIKKTGALQTKFKLVGSPVRRGKAIRTPRGTSRIGIYFMKPCFTVRFVILCDTLHILQLFF